MDMIPTVFSSVVREYTRDAFLGYFAGRSSNLVIF